MINKALEINNLTFSYPDKEKVINNISFELNIKDSLAIIGPNGAGKTTLFYLISGILKPFGGSIISLNKAVKYKEFNRNIGFVFQNPDDQLFSSTVYDDIAFGLINIGYSNDDIDKKVNNILNRLSYRNLIDRPSQHLSAGEKRMISLAAVIAIEPEILILDEPTSHLDMRSRRMLIQFLKETHITKIIASHDLEFLLELCDKTLLLDEGSIIKYDNTNEIMTNEKLMTEHGLEVPHSIKSKI
ncbi:MAG: energy-coupling factor ABC transporter ATP-binding protein [Spirochaetota bacterium]|nr:energy-coupling factor ABC transporter ATP-binding protein [Spirochaetota bacterium]